MLPDNFDNKAPRSPESLHRSHSERRDSVCLDRRVLETAQPHSSYETPRPEQQEQQTSSTKYKVLVVEDDPHQSRLYQQGLEDEGYEVKTADTREKAMEIVRGGHIDVVVTDCDLDKTSPFHTTSSGLYLIQMIKSEQPNTPIIFYTGHKSPALKRFVKQIGAYEALTKSSDLTPLKDAVKGAIQKYHGAGQSMSPLSDGTVDKYAEELDAEVERTRNFREELERSKEEFAEKGPLEL